MNAILRYTALFILSIFLGKDCVAQKYIIDTTFKFHFDYRNRSASGDVEDIRENPRNGKIMMVGYFRFDLVNPIEYHYGTTIVKRNGSRDFAFKGASSGDRIYTLGDSIFYVSGNFSVKKIDSTGTAIQPDYFTNIQRKSVRCNSTLEPLLFKDGSMLLSNNQGNLGSCDIILPPDTHPHQYAVKVNPQGLWDSTFKVTANSPPPGFIAYDSNRILVYGAPWRFTQFNGTIVNGLCRIFNDGTLDTTFKTPILSDTLSVLNPSWLWIDYVYPDGRFLAVGNFYLKDSTQSHQIMRFHGDGSLDTTFMNFNNAEDTSRWGFPWIETVAPLDDGGFFVGGSFNKFQGVRYNNIAKIDSNGRLDPTFNIGRGPEPDSNAWKHASRSGHVDVIRVSKFGGVYVGGSFYKWDGQPSLSIIRIVEDKTTSLNEFDDDLGIGLELYPNPANDQLYLKSNEKIDRLNLLDITGREHLLGFQSNGNNKLSMDTRHLLPNIYILQIQFSNGNLTTKKFIKSE